MTSSRMWAALASLLLASHQEKPQAQEPDLDKTGTSQCEPGKTSQKTAENQGRTSNRIFSAEGVGFEPTNGTGPSPVFKTGAFNRSAIPPDTSI